MAKASTFDLPGFLQVKQAQNGQGRGLFTTKRIRSGEEIFRCKPYVVGVSATTTAGLKSVCHHCARSVDQPTSGSAVTCEQCQVASYCCKSCQKDALPIHRVECKGLAELVRGPADERMIYRPFSESTVNYWPPAPVLTTIRALNRKVLEGKSTDEWEITAISKPDKLPPYKEGPFKHVLPLMWPLVLRSITTEEMLYDTYSRIAINAADGTCESAPSGVHAMALYTGYSLLNHCCVPNCYWEVHDGMAMVCALTEIEVGEQLCISYIAKPHQLLPGSFRRNKLMEVFGFECSCKICIDEREVGSPTWFLEQQKVLFIAPWSREMATLAMEEGRRVLLRLIQLQQNQDWWTVLEETEAVLSKLNRVLDEKNVIQYLLSEALLQAYHNLNQHSKGLQIAGTVLASVELYESSRQVQEVMSRIAVCHYKVGNVERGTEFAKKAFKQHPMRLSLYELSKQLKEQGIPFVIANSEEELRQCFRGSVPAMTSVSIDQGGKIDAFRLFSGLR